MIALSNQLRRYGANRAVIHPTNTEAIGRLRENGLELRPDVTRQPVSLRWRLFGEALVLRVLYAGQPVRLIPQPNSDRYFFAFTPIKEIEAGFGATGHFSPRTHRGALVDGSVTVDVPWSGNLPTSLVGIRRSLVAPLVEATDSKSLTILSAQRIPSIVAIAQFVDSLIDIQDNPTLRERARVGDILAQMVIHLSLATWDEAAGPPVGAGAHLTTAALQYIDQNYIRTNLSPQSVADAVGVSVRTLQSAFARIGTTPSREIAKSRLQNATQCLVEPRYRDRTMSEIAQILGFANPDTFRREFKRSFGVSPTAYRKAVDATDTAVPG